MIDISCINKEQSISTGRLIRKHSWVDFFDKIAFSIVAGVFIFYGVFTEIAIRVDGIFTGFLIYIVAPFSILIGVYCIYRKIFENNLEYVQTNLSKNENKEILKKFLEKYKYIISQQDDDAILVIDEHLLSFNGLWRKKYYFLIVNQCIYFNIAKLYPIISPPVLISHLILKSDLKKFVSKI